VVNHPIRIQHIIGERIADLSHYEKLTNLPVSWVWVKFADVCEIFNGNSINEQEKAQKYTSTADGYNYIGTKDVSFDGQITYENGIKIPLSAVKGFRIAHIGTPLLCIEGGSAGRKIGILSEDVCFGNKLCAFESQAANTRFLFYYLQCPEFQSLFTTSKSGLIGGVSINVIKSLSFALPPFTEQTRIVAKIDELFNQIDLLIY
jgi:type I restriction enzyme S subunit